jgi:NADH dehydrogenase
LLASLCKSENLENVYGRIVTEPTMLVKGFKHVWAVGDCAAIPVNGESSCPPTAQFAQRQGIQVSLNLQRALAGSPLKPFKYKSRGQLASIGHQRAVADIMGFQFSGFLAWFLWRTLYASKIPGLQRKLRVVIDWTLDLFFPRDISVIRTLEQGVLEDMPFKKGDVIVEERDPYVSVYIIKTGRVECHRDNHHLQTLESGDILGGSNFTADDKWNVRAAADAPTILISVQRRAWLSLNQPPSLLSKTSERESYVGSR